MQVDGLVDSVGEDFDMNQGAIAKSLLQKAGKEIQKELNQNRPSNVHYGDVVVTRAYGLSASWVFHGSLKKWSRGQDDDEQVCL